MTFPSALSSLSVQESDVPLIGQSTKRLQLVIDGPSVGIR